MKRTLTDRLVLRLLVNAIFIVATLVFASSASGQQIGYVLDMSGNWTLNNVTSLAKSSPVTASRVIDTDSPSERSNFITVADRDGKIIARRACRNNGECSRAIQLPQPPQRSVIKTFIDEVMTLLGSQPAKYETVAPKGEGLNEAVVRLKNKELDLNSVFKSVEAGDYTLKLEPLPVTDEARRGESVGLVLFHWDPDKTVLLSSEGLTSGLHRISLWQKDGEDYREIGTDAWVLISDDGKYESLHSSFDQAVALTKQWGKKVKPNTVRTFLRAELDLLSK